MTEAFLTHLRTEQGLSPLTLKAYATDLAQWERFMRADHPRGEFKPESYTTADLRLWVAALHGEGYSPTSIHRKASALKAFYRFLQRRGDVKINPAEDLSTPRAAKTLPVFIRPEESRALLDEKVDETDFEQMRNHLILLMLYTTGIRSSELTGLLDVNVDTARCELKVHGKRNKDRIIPFGEEMMVTIDKYRALRDRAVGNAADEFFVLASGKPLYRKALYNIVNSALGEAGVHSRRRSPHVLRHSFATDMLNGGAELNSVSHLMGHSSLASTQVYTHITYRELKQNYLTAHPRAQKKGENYGSKD